MSSQLLITTANSSFKLNCNNTSDFPNLDLEFSKNPLIINQLAFKTTINQTIFATSNQESRPVLTGINFKMKKNRLECTATDSYRLAKKEIELSEDIDHDIDIIVPAKNLLEILRLLNDDEDTLEIHVFTNKVIFKFGNLIIMSRLINGSYPDTNKLIPKEFATKIKVNLNNLFDAIDRASLLTNEDEKNIIKLESQGDHLLISSNIPEIGNVEERVDIDNKIKDEVKVSFSSKYMIDALKIFKSEEVEIRYNGDIKPLIITDGENEKLIQLILPIRTY
jgi:DNA polymerase-3 subunit beta